KVLGRQRHRSGRYTSLRDFLVAPAEVTLEARHPVGELPVVAAIDAAAEADAVVPARIVEAKVGWSNWNRRIAFFGECARKSQEVPRGRGPGRIREASPDVGSDIKSAPVRYCDRRWWCLEGHVGRDDGTRSHGAATKHYDRTQQPVHDSLRANSP